MKTPICNVLNLGIINYKQGLELQRKMVNAVSSREIENVLILLEHPPVITLGRRSRKENIIAESSVIEKLNIEIYSIERGGDVTYHCPGQVVGYPIIDLNRAGRDLHSYLRNLEEVLIRLLNEYKIQGRRIEGYTGVWVGDEKIGAIGVASRNWITFHGFSLNVNPNLENFSLIHPCGIREKGITSIKKLLKKNVNIKKVKQGLIKYFGDVFGFSMRNMILKEKDIKK